MKNTRFSIGRFLVGTVIFSGGIAAPNVAKASVVEPMEVRSLFIPNGFDDNDEIVVAMDGYLPDPCFKLRQPEITVDKSQQKITVSPMAERVSGVCPDVIVPFQQIVRVGVLNAGTYRVDAVRGPKQEPLIVKVASAPGPDEHLYAPVDSASVSRRVGTGLQATLRGRLTDTCLDFQDVRIVDSGKTFEVLPILRVTAQDPHGKPCRQSERTFEKTVALPELKPGRYLLHVRSMNGQSVNEIFGSLW